MIWTSRIVIQIHTYTPPTPEIVFMESVNFPQISLSEHKNKISPDRQHRDCIWFIKKPGILFQGFKPMAVLRNGKRDDEQFTNHWALNLLYNWWFTTFNGMCIFNLNFAWSFICSDGSCKMLLISCFNINFFLPLK